MSAWRILGLVVGLSSLSSLACEKPKEGASSDEDRAAKGDDADEDEDEADEDDGSSKGDKKKKAKDKKKKGDGEGAAEGEAEEDLAASPPKEFAVKLAPGRSATPTLAEWDAQREVTVKGSSALACETKMVREYLRVSCRGKNDTGGTPTGLRVVRGGREALVFAAGDIASLVIPFVEGIDAEIVFSWTDKSHPLTLKWPRGAPKPIVIGVFEGARSPLDGTAIAGEAQMADRLCTCFKAARAVTSCEEFFYPPNPDCDRTYAGDCQKLIECSTFEPSALPACLPGFVNAVTGHACMKTCGRATDRCPKGQTCLDMGASDLVCVPD